MDTSLTSIQQQLTRLEELVTSARMSADDLRQVELGLKVIIDRIDAIHALARDLGHPAALTTKDAKGLEELEVALKESIRKDGGDQS